MAAVVKEGVVRGAVAVAAGAPNPEKPEALTGGNLSFKEGKHRNCEKKTVK